MVVVSSLLDDVAFCPSKTFCTPVTPHETNLLLSEITVRQRLSGLEKSVQMSDTVILLG